MRRVAAIDIGTNSMRLLLCELHGELMKNKKKLQEVTRIGENVSRTGILSEEAISRNIVALNRFKKAADAYGAENIKAIATSAVRDAANGSEFAMKAEQLTGIKVNIIEGIEEADLGIIGVLSDSNYTDKSVLLIDIGGGSTELALYHNGSIKYSDSVDAGAVRMTESFILQHPVLPKDIEALGNELNKKFQKQIESLSLQKIDSIVAIGGTATTIAAIFHEMSIYSSEIIHNTIIDFDYLDMCFKRLSAMSVQERFNIPGLQKERADIIVAGIFILRLLLAKLQKNQIVVSDNDNLEGVIIKYLLRCDK